MSTSLSETGRQSAVPRVRCGEQSDNLFDATEQS